MAILKMFAVRDKKVGVFMKPLFDIHTGQALRSWQEACQQKDSPFAKFPDDFSLCQVGEFDDLTGKVQPLEMPIEISAAIEFANPESKQLKLQPTN